MITFSCRTQYATPTLTTDPFNYKFEVNAILAAFMESQVTNNIDWVNYTDASVIPTTSEGIVAKLAAPGPVTAGEAAPAAAFAGTFGCQATAGTLGFTYDDRFTNSISGSGTQNNDFETWKTQIRAAYRDKNACVRNVRSEYNSALRDTFNLRRAHREEDIDNFVQRIRHRWYRRFFLRQTKEQF